MAIRRVRDMCGCNQPKIGAMITKETMNALCRNPFMVSEWANPSCWLMAPRLALMMYLSM